MCSISSYISINKLYFSRSMCMRIMVFCCGNKFQFTRISLNPHSWVIIPFHTDSKAPFKVKSNYLLYFPNEHPVHLQLMPYLMSFPLPEKPTYLGVTSCCLVTNLGHPTLCNPTDCSRQAPLSMEFSRQKYWSGLPFPSPGDLPDPGTGPVSPALAGIFLTPSHPREVQKKCIHAYKHKILYKLS